jgi:AAA domain/Bifunctional DNA primase/polymerase, N-terminal
MTPLEIALEYIDRGWSPIPIPHKKKKPLGEEWPSWRITKADAHQWFNGEAQNVGVILGEASGGLSDVDLDTIEAVRAGPYFLQRTQCFGRASKPRSHWLYQSDLWQTEDTAARQFKFTTGSGKDRTEQMILELRIGGGGKGAQTVFPGSVHETGEPITWDDKENIARADGDSLKQRCARAASAALIAQHFPSKGARHDAGLTLGGFLSRCGFSRPDTELFAEAVTIASGQPREKVRDVRKAAGEAWDESKRSGGRARGFPALAETFGDDVAKHVAKWLGYQGNAHDDEPFFDGGAWEVPPHPGPDGEAQPSITVLQDAETLEMEIIEWLWLHWLALGKLHLIAGAPEAGKTTLALAFAAIISSGSHWPDGTKARAGNVLIWTSEDSLADTIKPRLVRMGADLSRIKFVIAQREANGKTRPFSPAIDMPSLIEAAKTINGGVQLLIIDPIVAAITSKTNSHNNAETRNSLQPVVDFAEAANCAVLGISHFTKGTAGKDPVERVTGSLAFGALPRMVFAAAKTDETAEYDMPRIFVRAKTNIGPGGGGFGYDIDAAPLRERPDIIATRIVWMAPLEGTAKDLLDAAGPQPETTKKENAEVLLMAILPKGERKLQSENRSRSHGKRNFKSHA